MKYDKAICHGWGKKEIDENYLAIREMDAYKKWKKKYFTKYYYVFHFRKKQETEKFTSQFIPYRHEKYRRNLKRKANAIMEMRENNPWAARRLRGIDACSSEDGCRPEVFAVAFRVLKAHVVPEKTYMEKVPQLRLSYHVGEDNQDVLDGLRAIDEAILFLKLGSGDRLGHATMLGVDPFEWYSKKHYKISIRKQDYLDNVVWLYQQIIRYHLPNEDNLLEYLEKIYKELFMEVYGQAIREEKLERKIMDYDIHAYYEAWKLRGDDPEYYRTGVYKKDIPVVDIWGRYGANPRSDHQIQQFGQSDILYFLYHFSRSVREEGKKSINVKIPFHLIRGIQEVQKMLMKSISKKGISIETNPSSNVLIAGMKGYETHPIVTFYNKKLVSSDALKADCPQIHVSINTDDAGVFVTSLHNEYSLMAKALESMVEHDGKAVYEKYRIYDWLDDIRKMGNEQSFQYRDRKKEKSDW